jgi:hypothetical protein
MQKLCVDKEVEQQEKSLQQSSSEQTKKEGKHVSVAFQHTFSSLHLPTTYIHLIMYSSATLRAHTRTHTYKLAKHQLHLPQLQGKR